MGREATARGSMEKAKACGYQPAHAIGLVRLRAENPTLATDIERGRREEPLRQSVNLAMRRRVMVL